MSKTTAKKNKDFGDFKDFSRAIALPCRVPEGCNPYHCIPFGARVFVTGEADSCHSWLKNAWLLGGKTTKTAAPTTERGSKFAMIRQQSNCEESPKISGMIRIFFVFLSKFGVKRVNSNVAKVIWTTVILVLMWGIVLWTGAWGLVPEILGRGGLFLVALGVVTGLLRHFYFRAFQWGGGIVGGTD